MTLSYSALKKEVDVIVLTDEELSIVEKVKLAAEMVREAVENVPNNGWKAIALDRTDSLPEMVVNMLLLERHMKEREHGRSPDTVDAGKR